MIATPIGRAMHTMSITDVKEEKTMLTYRIYIYMQYVGTLTLNSEAWKEIASTEGVTLKIA